MYNLDRINRIIDRNEGNEDRRGKKNCSNIKKTSWDNRIDRINAPLFIEILLRIRVKKNLLSGFIFNSSFSQNSLWISHKPQLNPTDLFDRKIAVVWSIPFGQIFFIKKLMTHSF